MADTRTAETIAQAHKACLDGADTINSVIATHAKGSDATDAEKKDRVKKNGGHLKLMVAKTDWKGNEDMTTVNKAITDGKAYVG